MSPDINCVMTDHYFDPWLVNANQNYHGPVELLEKSMHKFQGYCIFVGLIDIPALNQQEQDGVRRPVRYGTKKPKKQQQQQQQQQQDQEETEQPEGSTEDQGKKNIKCITKLSYHVRPVLYYLLFWA